MWLNSLKIQNFRSLEDVTIKGIGEFGVLIGQNNAGKSAILGALSHLRSVAFGISDVPRPARDISLLTDQDAKRELAYELEFVPRQRDRQHFVDLLIAAGHTHERRQELIDGNLLRNVHYTFRAPAGAPDNVEITACRIVAEDGKWATIFGPEGVGAISFSRKIGVDRSRAFDAEWLDVSSSPGEEKARGLKPYQPQRSDSHAAEPVYEDHPNLWAFGRIKRYFEQSVFLSTFRHSKEPQYASAQPRLADDAENLAVVLNYLTGADRDAVDRIEQLVHSALPDVGRLQAGLITGTDAQNNQLVKISFRTSRAYSIPLRNLGAGVEQLLLIAVILATTGDETTLFLEEPETQLHPGAQRHLINRLQEGERQVLVTTHSPTVVNDPSVSSLHHVSIASGRTTVTQLGDATALAGMLNDIGVRKSDVLMSDAVLFVEGPTDRDVILAWDDKLGGWLSKSNVTVLPTGGGDSPGRQLRARSEALTEISRAAPLPHLFMIDGDERSTKEIASLKSDLGERLKVLKRREIENYLLVPRAIREALISKYSDDGRLRPRVEQATIKQIDSLILEAASELFGTVLMKRIRSEIGGLKEGLLPKEIVVRLSSEAHADHLPILVENEVKKRFDDAVSELDVPRIVTQQSAKLAELWNDHEALRHIAPGDEILQRVFAKYDCHFAKGEDSERIAKEMTKEEIDPEIVNIIRRASELPHDLTWNADV